MSDDDGALRELAESYGVATQYWDWRNEHVRVAPETLIAVLAALDVEARTPEQCTAALHRRRSEHRRRMLPPYLVLREGEPRTVDVNAPDGASVEVWVTREDGTFHAALPTLPSAEPPVEVEGAWLAAATVEIPAGLPSGYHTLHARTAFGDEASARLLVPPPWLGLPARLGERKYWGLAVQLYSVRSRRSWGIGDLTDLADLATWAAAEHDAAFVLVNPMHAAEPVPPVQPSPYLPTSRRFGNPGYLHIERIPEYAELSGPARAAVERCAAGLDNSTELIDRDAVWTAKRAALEVIHAVPRRPGRELGYRSFRRREGGALDDFATWCAAVEVHGADWHAWPDGLRHPRGAAVAPFAAEHADLVDFHRWQQWLLDDQSADAQSVARRNGMALGVMHDLAVGVSPAGADSWAWQDELARGITVGAPPDAYAQTGQDWRQPPWRPDRLAELGYEPLRELVRAALRHCGGLRVDHIIGLFRLWWIPSGAGPKDGTYVRYDHDAAVGILMLEAARAGAVVVGEDLGTVEPWVRDHLRERGVLGTSVLWFEADYDGGGGPLPPERWREYCLASVTTHDLPPTAGYLAGVHVKLRHDLGLLTRSLDDELAADRVEQLAWLGAMRERGLLDDQADEEQIVLALHRALAFTPARLSALALTDAVGDRRVQNQPGANTGYPNWQIPLSGPDGRPVLLEDVFSSDRAARLAAAMRFHP